MDELAPAADNKRLQGDDVAFDALTPTVRVGNYTQIASKRFIISGTQEAVDKAGRKSEVSYQIAKAGKELKRDMEVTCFGVNKGGVAGNSNTPPELASILAWIKTNTVKGTGGVDPSWSAGVPSAGRTDGTQAAFTEAMLKEACRKAFASGAEPTTLMVGPFNKQRVSTFAGIAPPRWNTDGTGAAVIIGAADFYRSDFGLLAVVANRFQRERDAFLIDFDQLAIAYLRPFFAEKLAKTGDAEKWHEIVEYTLVVKNERGLAGVFDLTTS
jgi:hypothetical protein